MRISLFARMAGSLMVAVLAAACATVQQKPMVLEPGEKTLMIKAENFKFEPNLIKAHQGDVLTIKMESGASTEHNLTIKTPQGDTMTSVEIPAKGTVSVTVNLTETGTYHFYCAKPFHSTFGMKGQIEVAAP